LLNRTLARGRTSRVVKAKDEALEKPARSLLDSLAARPHYLPHFTAFRNPVSQIPSHAVALV
jgi:hypothetical protein